MRSGSYADHTVSEALGLAFARCRWEVAGCSLKEHVGRVELMQQASFRSQSVETFTS